MCLFNPSALGCIRALRPAIPLDARVNIPPSIDWPAFRIRRLPLSLFELVPSLASQLAPALACHAPVEQLIVQLAAVRRRGEIVTWRWSKALGFSLEPLQRLPLRGKRVEQAPLEFLNLRRQRKRDGTGGPVQGGICQWPSTPAHTVVLGRCPLRLRGDSNLRPLVSAPASASSPAGIGGWLSKENGVLALFRSSTRLEDELSRRR